MADGSNNKQLSHEAAEALLTSIKKSAQGDLLSSNLLNLAQAYALIVEAMPRPSSKPASARQIR